MSRSISIIIPVYREAEGIRGVISRVQALGTWAEIIVVDGDPSGSTVDEIELEDVIRIRCRKGRAAQLNAGAAIANGEVLVFLHADTVLPSGAIGEIDTALAGEELAGGCFDLELDDSSFLLRFYSRVINLRTRWLRIPVGDQAIFLMKDVFHAVGGYADLPILEEVDLMWRIKRRGWRIRVVSDPVVVSARRFQREGPLRRIALNTMIGVLYYLGVSPTRLERLYRDPD